jgi:hypothetical protein
MGGKTMSPRASQRHFSSRGRASRRRTTKRHLTGLYSRALHIELLEDRRLLSVSPYPELPGMVLVDSRPDQFDDQIVFLDFDSTEDVTYNGPVVVEQIDVSAFEAPGALAGHEQEIIADAVAQLDTIFADTGIVFTTDQPVTGTEYSTIYIGGDGSEFSQYGSFVGLAEKVDVGNHDAVDNAFVFSDVFAPGYLDADSLAAALTKHITHEAGHLVGYAHDAVDPRAGVLSEVANGTLTVEFVACPSVVGPDELVDVEVRIKFEGNTQSGPWQVTDLGLYDDDIWPLYNMIAHESDPFEISSLGTWYNYTFQDVEIGNYADGGDGVELYAWGEVDDNTFNGFSPDGSSAIQQVTVRRYWTVMVYLDGDNNLEKNEMYKFQDMAKVGSSDELAIVVQYDRTPVSDPLWGGTTEYDDWTNARRGLVNSGDVPDENWGESVGEVKMGVPASVTEFANWAIMDYPADRYALILSDHGGGVNGGVCYDDTPDPNNPDNILTTELHSALSSITEHLDVTAPTSWLARRKWAFGTITRRSSRLSRTTSTGVPCSLAETLSMPIRQLTTRYTTR